MRTVLFYRDFRVFSGGHMKVWHYFNHVGHLPGFCANICFSRRSIWDQTNPWRELRLAGSDSISILSEDGRDYADHAAHVRFLGGLDWEVVPEALRRDPPVPVINRIAGIGHVSAGGSRRTYLRYKAIRICNSQDVADAIRETAEVNGPVFTIPNGIDSANLPTALAPAAKDLDLVVVGYKRPELARKVTELLAARRTTAGQPPVRMEVVLQPLPRPKYLALVNRARIGLFLPLPKEGFYNPPLEGMALGVIPVCADFLGNRGHYRDGFDCFRPPADLHAITDAVEAALSLPASDADRMHENGRQTVARSSLEIERSAVHDVLSAVDQLW